MNYRENALPAPPVFRFRPASMAGTLPVVSDNVRIEWHRRSRVSRHEQVALADVHEIAIAETPGTDGETLYILVVGMKNNGEIAISERSSPSAWKG
jgi:hypothetical protein